MTQETLNYVIEKSKELMNAATCSKEAREAAQNWLDAVGTDTQSEVTRKYMAELEADIMPVEGLIAFAESEAGVKVFGGEDAARKVAAHGRELQAAGGKYCDCPACAAVEAILAKKDDIL